MRPALRRTLACLGAALGIWGCGLGGGSGTETTSGGRLYGRLAYADGSAAVGAGVAILPIDSLPDTSLAGDTLFRAAALSDAAGSFTLERVKPGRYLLEIRDASGNAALAEAEVAPRGNAVEVRADPLRPAGSLSGSLGRIAGAPDRGYIRFPGLRRVYRADSAGGFHAKGLPPGRLRPRLTSARPTWGYADSLSAVIPPGDTARLATQQPFPDADEDYASWPRSRSLVLKTAAAGLTATVMDFPLLVRLDSGIIDFVHAESRSLRFADASGRHLPHALDHWDSAAGKAAFWVRLDSVQGNRDDQGLTLYWGKAGAPDRSDGPAVFGDLSGAWRLQDSVDGAGSGSFRDASPTGADGAGTVATGAGRDDGVIGAGKAFQGSHGIQVAGRAAFRPAEGMTLSAWAKVTALDSFGAEIVSMGDDYGLRVATDGALWFFLATEATLGTDTWRICDTEGLDLRDGAWHLLAGTYDGAAMRVYVDGLERVTCPVGEKPAFSPGRDLWMGRHGNGKAEYDLTGGLDHVQSLRGARPAAWFRLQAVNQHPASVLIIFP